MEFMKVKQLASILACAFVAGSCVSDDVAGVEPVDSSMITFSAVVPAVVSRGAPTTTATISNFAVTAFANGKKLMDNVLVEREGANWECSTPAYWPDSPVNFYSVSPDLAASPDVDGSPTGTASINNYANPGNVDLLYAVNYGEIQTAAPVRVNFRHALSMVDVRLSSDNADIIVKVRSVEIGNIYKRASFFYPRQTTYPDSDASGYWHSLALMGIVTLYSSEEKGGTLVLTPDVTDVSDGSIGNNIDFFIPQQLDPLSYDESSQSFTGTYISVDCEIFDKATGGKLFPGSHTPDYILVPGTDCGRIMYPASGGTLTQWKIGYAYVYNISINNPAVLFDGIEFGVTVDEFNDENISESSII